MRIEQLEYFAEAAKYHSISIAADKLFVSHPAVSIAIKNLENELGCILFERSKNGLVLTKIGHKVLKKCETILKEEKSIYQLVEGEKKEPGERLQGELSVLAIPMLVYSFLNDAAYSFLDKNDGVNLIIRENNVNNVTADAVAGKVDVAFTMLDEEDVKRLGANKDIYIKKLTLEKTYIVAHKRFGLGGNLSLRKDELKDFPFVSFSNSHISEQNIFYTDTDKQTVSVMLKTYSLDLIKRFIINGKAITALSSSAISKMEIDENIDIIPISDLSPGVSCVIYNENSPKIELIKAFEEEVIHCY